jgi:hypothetical protein
MSSDVREEVENLPEADKEILIGILKKQGEGA